MSTIEENEGSSAWWEKQENTDPHEILYPYIQKLRNEQNQRYEDYKKLISIFQYGPRKENQELCQLDLSDTTIQANWARRACLTVISKLTKTVSTPMPLTTGGTWDDRENAENLGKAIDGEFRRNKVDALIEKVVTDGVTLADGYFYVPHGLGEVKIEWLPTEDLVIDPSEGRYGKPQSIYIRRLIDKQVLLAKYGKENENLYGSAANRKAQIVNAAREQLMKTAVKDRRYGQQQVEVWMAFHLGTGQEDGRYSVVINGCTLEWCEWNRDTFPVAKFTPWVSMREFHGLSMLGEITNLQRDYDITAGRVQLSNKRLGSTMLLIDRGSGIDENDINNGQGQYIFYNRTPTGERPIEQLNPVVANESAIQYMQRLVDSMMSLYAIPSMVMTGQPPAGLKDTSGKALELADEQAAEALINQHRAKEACLVDLAWLVINEAEAICEEEGAEPKEGEEKSEKKKHYSVNVYGKKGESKAVRWKDVIRARDEYTLDIRPAGDLARSPAARLKQCLDMLDRGAITTPQFKKLFNMPDLEAANDMDLADEDIILKVMTAIVRHKKPFLPEEFDNLQLCIVLGRKFYNLCRVNDVEEDRLSLLKEYIQRAFQDEEKLKARAAAMQAAATPQPPPGGPQGPVPGEQPMQQAA